MMHAQVVGVAPAAPEFLSAIRDNQGRNNNWYDLTWNDNSKNETAFVVERRAAGSTGPFTVVATVPSDRLDEGPGTGERTYRDSLGRTNALYEYQVYAINVVGDTWDYSNPALNAIPPGGGWPTLTLDSRGGNGPASSAIVAPSNLTGLAAAKNKKQARVVLNWIDNSVNETGFLVQRADDMMFTAGVVNATVAGDVTAFEQTVARGKTFYYRVHAFNDTTQSDWSNTATIITP